MGEQGKQQAGGRPVVFMASEHLDYDAEGELAIDRRSKGLCGYCGHPSHNRKIGCEVCGPEVCPIIFEIDDPDAVQRIHNSFAEDGP